MALFGLEDFGGRLVLQECNIEMWMDRPMYICICICICICIMCIHIHYIYIYTYVPIY